MSTVNPIEVVWTLVALPGLLLWLSNRGTAGRARRATRRMQLGEPQVLWARFSVLLTDVFVGIETVFLMIGVVSLFQPSNPSPDYNPLGLIVISSGLIGASVFVTLVGYRWRQVDRRILELARARTEKRLGPRPVPPPAAAP